MWRFWLPWEIAQEVLAERRKKEALLSEADDQINSFTRRLENSAEGELADRDLEDDAARF